MPILPEPLGTPTSQVTVGEISARRGVALSVQGDVTESSPLISGRILHRNLPEGLQIHGGVTFEEQAFQVESSISDGLSCIFFLRGHVDVSIGGKALHFRADGRGRIAASALLSGSAESFHRCSAARQRVTHLVVGASGHWLERHAASFPRSTRGLVAQGWQVSARANRLISDILEPRSDGGSLADLYAEAHAIEIIAEAITALTDPVEVISPQITPRHREALGRAKDFILGRGAGDLSVEMIAREAGLSVSGLQALFRQVEGCGVFTYVRNARLAEARNGLLAGEIDIGAASALAGYTNPANFATAFRRRFGCAPSEIRVGGFRKR